GMITTKDPSLFHQIQKLRSHGSNAIDPKKPWELPDVEEPGFNYRMTDLQASIGLVQLKKLGSMIEERKKMAFFYQENLESLSWFFLPKVPKGFDHSWQSFVGRINPQKIRLSRDQIMAFLLSKGIHTRPGTHALPALSVFKRLG